MQNNINNGFSLLELIVVVGIAGILASLVTPMLQSFQSYNHDQKTSTLIQDIKLSRSEAAKRNTWVTIRRTGDSWQGGWISFVDSDGDGTKDNGESIVFGSSAALEINQLANGSNFADYIRFSGNGAAHAAGWLVMTNSADASLRAVICVVSAGRVNLSRCPSAADPCEFSNACP